MKQWLLCALLVLTVSPAWADLKTGSMTSSGMTNETPPADAYGQVVRPIQGNKSSTLTLASDVTTNTTSTAVAGVTGSKTFWAEVICSSGACTQTVAIYGARTSTAANGILLCTITLSGTPRAQDACAVSTAAYQYYYVVTTNTGGTGATGAIYAFH